MSTEYPFILSFDPSGSPQYKTGYWYAYAEPGYDGSGSTPENAMAELICAMAKLLKGEEENEHSSSR